MQVTMKQNRFKAGGVLMAVGSTQDLPDDFALDLVRQGAAAYVQVPDAVDFRPDGASTAGAVFVPAIPTLVGGSKRPPTFKDNLAIGQKTGGLWAHDGVVFENKGSNQTHAAWDRINQLCSFTTEGLASVQFAGGFFQITPGYVGPAVDIKFTVSGSPVTETFNILANGEFDNAGLFAAMASADAGTFARLVKIYAQDGSANTALADATLAGNMLVDWDQALGCFTAHSAIVTGWTGAPYGLKLSSGIATNGRAATVAFVGRGNLGLDGGQSVLCSLGDWSNANAPFTAFFQTSDLGTIQKWMTGGPGSKYYPGAAFDAQPMCGVAVAGTNYSSCTINGLTITDNTTPTLQTQTGGWIGTDKVAFRQTPARIAGIIITGAAATADQIKKLTYGACAKFNVRPQVKDSIYVITDSRGGAYADQAETYPDWIAAAVEQECRVMNWGVGSATAATLKTAQMAELAAQVAERPGAKHIVVAMCGVNDFISSSSTPEAVYGHLVQLAANAKAAGATHVVLVAELVTTSVTGGANSKVVALRSLIQAAGRFSMGVDTIVYPTDAAQLSNASDVNYYPDGLHLSAAAMGLLGGMTAEAINSL